MITALRGTDRQRRRHTFDAMFRLRYQVFIERLGWPLRASNGREIDQFDHDAAHYLVLENVAGDVVASCRMTPTSEPNLLTGIFPHLVHHGSVPDADEVWEVSRVAVDHDRARLALLPHGVNPTGMLFCAMFEYAMLVGAHTLVSVSDPVIERILKMSGWRLQPLGPAVPLPEGGSAVAESAIVSREQLAAIRKRTRTPQAVLEAPPAGQALPRAA
jgi:acyl homoserine lactone synthase